jgi:uncharacterized membrane protein YeaQ/YmgE (transglycosylase-associated protein family)
MSVLVIVAEGGSFLGGTTGLIVALVVGGLIGWVASILMKTNAQMGIVANIAVGVIGSWGGHYLAGMLGIGAVGTVGRLLISLCGAVLLIVVLRFFRILR